MDMLERKLTGSLNPRKRTTGKWGKAERRKKWFFSGKNPLPTQLVIQYQVVNSESIYIVSIIQTEHVLFIYYVIHTTKQRKRCYEFERVSRGLHGRVGGGKKKGEWCNHNFKIFKKVYL